MRHIPCDPDRECALRDTVGCYEDVDHYYWPKRWYLGSLAVQFRNLDENKTLICRNLHNERHATERPPEVPSRSEMIVAIRASQQEVA